MSLPQLKLDNQICFLVYRLEHRLMEIYKPLLKPLGLTYPQYLALLILWEKDGMPVAALAEKLHLDTGTVSPLLKRMEKAGLVTRTRNPEDERSVLVTLTKKGKEMEARAADIPFRLVECIGNPGNVDPGEFSRALRLILGDSQE